MTGDTFTGDHNIKIGDNYGTINIDHAPLLTLRATPPAPPPHFTGRDDDLVRFTQLLTSGKNVAITALQGMGGIGKTALAQKLAELLNQGDPAQRSERSEGVEGR